jgi:predicted component of type VI protein secretion system
MYRITFLNGPARGRRLTVRTGSVRIGRGPDCAVRLSDPAMADRHAEVDEQDGVPHLRNLDPLHGIEVDGRKMEAERIRLAGRERIRIGTTELRVEPLGVARRISTRRWTSGQAATLAAILALLCMQGLAILSLSSMNKPAVQAAPDTTEPEIVPPPPTGGEGLLVDPEEEPPADSGDGLPVDSGYGTATEVTDEPSAETPGDPSTDADGFGSGEDVQPEPAAEPPQVDAEPPAVPGEGGGAAPEEAAEAGTGDTQDETQRPADAIDAQA